MLLADTNHKSMLEVYMRLLCIALVLLGTGIMLFSVFRYYNSLKDLKAQININNSFGDWIYRFCLILMLFFLIGYMICLVMYAIKEEVSMDDLLISAIFFFGAIFVFAMGTMMRRMFKTMKENTELIIAKEMAEQSGRAKSIFLANMSHEIRTPMNSILGFAELALDDELSLQTRESLNKIKANTNVLLHIVNDILDTSKIESGKMKMESIPFDLHSVFSRCQSMILPSVKKNGLELYVDAPQLAGKMLMGDPYRLNQALTNLLSNAVKFTHAGTVMLTSSIVSLSSNDVTIYFAVEDSGIGINPQQIEIIFEPFTQADSSTTRKYGGSGLGLVITKNIINLMGGELKVESTLGVGSIFSFEIKFETIDKPDTVSDHAVDNVLEKPHFDGLVLICEDNEVNQQLICEHLHRVGLHTIVAENGKIGLDMVRERQQKGLKPFDLILMDIFMPVMDGIEAASKIIELDTGTPLVAMTANIMQDELEKYKMKGMYDHVGKPFTSLELWRCLLKYLSPVTTSLVEESEQELENDVLLMKLKINFIKSNQNKYLEIVNAIEANDLALVHRLVHSLKTNAGMIGKTKLQNASAVAESLLKEGIIPQEEQMASIEVELNTVLEELKPLLDESKGQLAYKNLDSKQTLALFKKLEVMLENINPECVDLLDDLRAIPGTEKLARQIEDFDFEFAANTLSELMKGWKHIHG